LNPASPAALLSGCTGRVASDGGRAEAPANRDRRQISAFSFFPFAPCSLLFFSFLLFQGSGLAVRLSPRWSAFGFRCSLLLQSEVSLQLGGVEQVRVGEHPKLDLVRVAVVSSAGSPLAQHTRPYLGGCRPDHFSGKGWPRRAAAKSIPICDQEP
jgi:hypothetical protein